MERVLSVPIPKNITFVVLMIFSLSVELRMFPLCSMSAKS